MKQNFEFKMYMYLYEFLTDWLQIVNIEIKHHNLLEGKDYVTRSDAITIA
jgi:hypothetical protein